MVSTIDRIIVGIVSVMLLSWGGAVNFIPSYASSNLIDDLQQINDDIDFEINANPGTPLADKLEDTANKFEDVIAELNKDPPDIDAAKGNIFSIQQEIQVAIDDEGFSPILGNGLILLLENLKNEITAFDDPPVDDPPVSVTICHIPPGNPDNAMTKEIPETALAGHLGHGDMVGECPVEEPAVEVTCSEPVTVLEDLYNGGYITHDCFVFENFAIKNRHYGVIITDIETVPGEAKLVLDVDVTGTPVFIQIKLPRDLLDSKVDGMDVPFIVENDNIREIEQLESDSDYRMIDIHTKTAIFGFTDSQKIVISGTHLFGSPVEDEVTIDGVEPKIENVVICHLPPGNLKNIQTLVISSRAVESHLGHGDIIGSCNKNNDDEVQKKIERQEHDKNSKKIKFKETQKELKKELKKLSKLEETISEKKEINDSIKEMKLELKELIKELKENYAYDQEHKKDIKQEIKEIKINVEKEKTKHEKKSKQKVDSKINSLSKSDDPKSDAKRLGLDFKKGKTKIVLKLSDLPNESLEKLESLGKITAKNDNHVQMTVNLKDISKIRLIDGIEKIRPPFSAIQFVEQVSEGVYFINADLVQHAGITGKGVKVAVLDLAFTDNPKISNNIVEVKSFRDDLSYTPIQGYGDEGKHGTAVAEIITDVAPNVELYLYAMETDLEFASAVDEAVSQNVDVIAMSAGWPHFPTDGTSHITKKIEEATSKGIVFVVPAGNFGNKHWEGTYGDSNINGWHEFTETDEGLSIEVTAKRISDETPISAYLMWDEKMGDVVDLDMVLVDPLGQIVDYSNNAQTSKSDSNFEYIQHVPDTEGTYAIGIVNSKETPSPAYVPTANIEIFTPNDELEHSIAVGSVSVPADANGAIVVGAVNHIDGSLEPFSSQGPTNHGMLAPHLVGPDGVSTISLDEPFYGTSATTPYIAGMAALLLEINPDISPKQLLDEIKQHTVTDFDSAEFEFDNAVGYGQVDAIFLTQIMEEVT